MQLTVTDDHTRSGWLDQFDPRLRLLTALLFALTTVSLQQTPLLLLVLAASLLSALFTGLTGSLLLKRLLAMEGFMILLLIMLPFSVPGDSLFTLGSFSASTQGLERVLQIVLKANAIVIMLMTLIGTLEPVVLGHALGQLRLPEKLIHLFLFTVRYIGVLFDEYQRLRMAMRARAFVAGSNRHTWRSFGWLIGMLLVRSLERSQRILAAMKCRGFNGRLYLITTEHWQRRDSVILSILSLFFLLLLLSDHLL
ncbi:cobalt ECF transporter T component CbiQ [Sedimenticola selenatireducens]|uniref:Cobalt ECF transporter T component CbiQ n=1 Tax=Sedimenticola selenatireducens TaxID=191960 RepID=A0A558DVS5_9GAMM|nr:cobalt ECF transporter T component CbiQ [Sedimenticola selenatireducens]TVO77849.1 cobalt ECF transporter T component CbiQ [Sedimenticola selenatireducens]TVT65154.1 MAG: cobalt ECF transporter T component CbiQ [Sedimenticola selenatireducens]